VYLRLWLLVELRELVRRIRQNRRQSRGLSSSGQQVRRPGRIGQRDANHRQKVFVMRADSSNRERWVSKKEKGKRERKVVSC
jgi:hypothetical protein